jgi:hypothetical protein
VVHLGVPDKKSREERGSESQIISECKEERTDWTSRNTHEQSFALKNARSEYQISI